MRSLSPSRRPAAYSASQRVPGVMGRLRPAAAYPERRRDFGVIGHLLEPIQARIAPISRRSTPTTRRPTPPAHATPEREQSTSPRERNTSPREQGASPHEQGASPHEQSASPREQSTSPREQSTSPREQSTSPRERGEVGWRRGVGSTAVAVVGVAMLAGCASWGPEGGPGGIGRSDAPQPTATASTPAVAATRGPDGVQRITVSLTDDLKFVPDRVSARPGVIEFRLQNVGVTPHDMTVADTTVGNLNGGRTAVLRVTVPKPGQYPFPCLYHAESGMRGVLEVAAE